MIVLLILIWQRKLQIFLYLLIHRLIDWFKIHSFILRMFIASLQGSFSETLPTPAWPNKTIIKLRDECLRKNSRGWAEHQRKAIPNREANHWEGTFLPGGGTYIDVIEWLTENKIDSSNDITAEYGVDQLEYLSYFNTVSIHKFLLYFWRCY